MEFTACQRSLKGRSSIEYLMPNDNIKGRSSIEYLMPNDNIKGRSSIEYLIPNDNMILLHSNLSEKFASSSFHRLVFNTI